MFTSCMTLMINVQAYKPGYALNTWASGLKLWISLPAGGACFFGQYYINCFFPLPTPYF